MRSAERLARNLKRQRTETGGLVLGDISNPYSAELANAVRERHTSSGYNLFICISEHSATEDITAFEATQHLIDLDQLTCPAGKAHLSTQAKESC